MPRKRALSVGLIGYQFMGKAHSNAWRQAPRFFDLGAEVKLKTICGRDKAAVRRAANEFGWEETETDWRRVVADPEIEKVFPALQRVVVTITTTDGRNFTEQLDYPKGDPRNPLSDKEVEEKFAALAEGVLSRNAQNKVKDAVWNLEKSNSASDLMKLLKSDASG